MFCLTLLYVHSSFAIILMGERELVTLCLVIVVWLFLAVPRVCLQFVIVVFNLITHTYFFDKMPGLVWILTVQYVNTWEINGPNNKKTCFCCT